MKKRVAVIRQVLFGLLVASVITFGTAEAARGSGKATNEPCSGCLRYGWSRRPLGTEVNRSEATGVSSITRRVGGFSGLVLGCLLGSCSPAADPVEPREVPLNTTTGNPGDTVQRGNLKVTVTAAGEASQALEALGAPAGRVPEAHVRIRRSGESEVVTGTADADGLVAFTDLIPGRYDVSALRLLSADETARTTEADSALTGINVLGGGRRVQVQPPSSTTEVEAVAGRRGSLVISELHDWSPRETGGPTVQYSMAKYVEVYNNADTTVYLDGKIIAQAFDFVWESDASPSRCLDYERWRLDSEGIWSQRALRFPGSGRQYPVLAGRARVVAQQAINHDELYPGFGLPDLSRADFEVVGTGQDIDNPAVPNMEHVGFRPSVDPLGRGFLVGAIPILVIVDNVDLESLPTDKLPLNYPDYHRFPGEAILDLVTIQPVPRAHLSWRFCERLVSGLFDRQVAIIKDEFAGNSIHRRVLGATRTGHPILQRSKTSAVDLVRGPRSPGRVP